MLGNTQNKDSVKEENKKLNFWFWVFGGLAVICAIFFVFAAISLLGMTFPGVFGGLWAGISKVPFIAGIFSSVLFNVIDIVIMLMVFVFCVREAKKEIKSHVTDENKDSNQSEVEEVKVINDGDKNKNEMEQNKEKNENHIENKIYENKINQDANENNNKENKIDEDKVNQEANENNNKENKNDEAKGRKPAKTVGEIADIFLADTLELMSEGDMLNGEYTIKRPMLSDDWRNLLKHGEYYSRFIDPIDSRLNFMKVNMQSEHFGHGKLPITISSEHVKQKLNEIQSIRQKNDNEYELKTQKREAQERQVRDELRKKKRVSPQMEDCNKDENKNM